MCFGHQSRRADARGVMLRLLQIAMALSTVIALILLAGRHRLPLIFSRDPAVVRLVAACLPLLAVCMVRMLGPRSHTVSATSRFWCFVRKGCQDSVRQ